MGSNLSCPKRRSREPSARSSAWEQNKAFLSEFLRCRSTSVGIFIAKRAASTESFKLGAEHSAARDTGRLNLKI
jgi:hypothetical protein